MFLTFRYETDNKQILKLCPITVGFQLTQIFKWKVTLTSVMNMEKFCCLCNRSFNSGNIHRRSINSFTWYWLKYRNIEGKYWNLHAIILSNIIIGNTLLNLMSLIGGVGWVETLIVNMSLIFLFFYFEVKKFEQNLTWRMK